MASHNLPNREKPPCTVCEDLSNYSKDSFDLTTAAIAQSAIAGCDVCEILKNSITHARPDFLGRVSKVAVKRVKDKPLELTWNVRGVPSTEIVEIYSHAESPTVYPWAAPSTEISLDSSSPACFDLIKSWISDCLASHASCPVDRSPLLPTRVVDVGSSETQPPRLHISTPNQRGEYLALSHCWGPQAKAAKTIKTTATTLQAHQTEIPWEKLSKTFQDAVTITRNLGFRYLWIDSLCIIQGDADDWAVEASRMTTVYTKAFLVISASGSPDGEGGCFRSGRSASSEGILAIPCAGVEGKGKSAVYVRRSQRGIYFTLAEMRGGEYPHGWKSAYGQPLDKRAWTYQEEELATRVLLYTEDELQWRCSEVNACECKGVRKSETESRGQRLRLGQFAGDTPQDAKLGEKEAKSQQQRLDSVKAWCFIVAEYTRRDITYNSDRLPGLSGIAGCWEESEDDRYHAGLWDRDLPRHLLWWSHSGGLMALAAPERGSLRHEGYYAPTWSWASVTGGIQHQRDPGEVRVRVVDVQTELATVNRFGPVKRGNLILAGLLIPVRLEPQPKNPLFMNNSVMIKTVDARDDAEKGKNKMGLVLNDMGMVLNDMGMVLPDVMTEDGELEIDATEGHWFVPVACKEGALSQITGLVVRRSKAQPNVFERVGLLAHAMPFPSWAAFARETVEREINLV